MPVVKNLVDEWVGSLPQIYYRLRDILDKPDFEFGEIADLISNDTGLSLRLLKIVNSSFYGFPTKIETISHALSIIGTEQLSHLVLATQIIEQFQGIPRELVDMDRFWRHSIACGVGAQILARNRDPENLERYFLCGMLHDVGKLVIYKKLPKVAKECMELVAVRKEPVYLLERELLGYDHSTVGEHLLLAWNLPQILVETVAYHHEPYEARDNFFQVGIVHLADLLAKEMGYETVENAGETVSDSDALNSFSLSEAQLEEIKSELTERVQTIIEMFI